MRIPGDEDESRVPGVWPAAILHALGRDSEIEHGLSRQPRRRYSADQLANGYGTVSRREPGPSARRQRPAWAIQSGHAFGGPDGHAARRARPTISARRRRSPTAGASATACSTCCRCSPHSPTRSTLNAVPRLFHSTLIAALTEWLCSVAPEGSTVAAGGGCLQNQVLVRGLRNSLSARGLHLVESRRLPPSDGGLALGQAWVAQQRCSG